MDLKKQSKTISTIAKRMLKSTSLNLTVDEKIALRKWKFNQMPETFRRDKTYQHEVAQEIRSLKRSEL